MRKPGGGGDRSSAAVQRNSVEAGDGRGATRAAEKHGDVDVSMGKRERERGRESESETEFQSSRPLLAAHSHSHLLRVSARES